MQATRFSLRKQRQYALPHTEIFHIYRLLLLMCTCSQTVKAWIVFESNLHARVN